MSAVMQASAQTMKITKVKEHIGAIVTGIDLSEPVDAATQKKLYDAAVENVVLVIRGQAHLTPAQVQAAGELFGELMEDQNRLYLVDGFPLISVLDNFHRDSQGNPAKVGTNSTWHTDHTNQERPPKFTMLYAVAVPDKGGATSVCNSRAAYESLPEDLKEKITGMKTENTLISSARFKIANPDVLRAQLESRKPPTVQPLVRTHPETARKALYLNFGHTARFRDWTEQESAPLLDYLFMHQVKPEFTCRFQWEPGSLAFWDNRCAQHYPVNDYHGFRRVMHRVTLEGDPPR